MPAALSEQQFRAVVQAGVLAPSAENYHPLRFARVDCSLFVLGTTQFVQAAPHRRVLLLMSAGAVVQNMLLAAGDLGFEYVVRWFPDPQRPELVARLDPGPGAPAADVALVGAIRSRHTNRTLRYSGPPLRQEERQWLESDAHASPGVTLFWLDQKDVRRKALKLVRIAETERYRCRPMHDELFSSVRFDLGWKAAAAEGLSPGALGVERPLRPAFALLRHWGVMRLLNVVGVHHIIGIRAGSLPCRLCPHLAVIAADDDLESGAMAAGMAFQRVWLRASALGLALQPLAAAALFTLASYNDVRDSVRRELVDGWAELVPEKRPMMLFRLGHAPRPVVGTTRKHVATYLFHEQQSH
jgi:hypothetical protein